ncbi:MAG: XdhC family protein [Syntrophaceae bacterium]|nr:XdhC family protein [Syntrophaceae bacterium]
MRTPFRCIRDLLADGTGCAVAQIISTRGSAPRAAGTRMIVPIAGRPVGTVGGGILEARAAEIARGVLETGEAVLETFVLEAEKAGDAGMMCGGTVELLVYRLEAADPDTLSLYREAAAILESRGRARLVTRLPGGTAGGRIAQWLIRVDGSVLGPPEPEGGLHARVPADAGSGEPRLLADAGGRFLLESLYGGETVHLFGAGHVARSLAPLLEMTGFRTVVLDDRAEFANRDRFPGADRIVLLDAWDRALEGLDAGPKGFLVIMTRGHAFDRDVLQQALRTAAGYIGMISSRRKRDAIFAALREEGFTEEDLKRVYAPIGLPIGAETPEEIAVSIAAELIRHRAGIES